MIDFVLEVVDKTISNSLFMFLFCNFIILLILVGNFKPGSEDKLNSGSLQYMYTSESVLSSNSGFEKSVLISNSNLSAKPEFISESVLSSKSGFEKSMLISKSVLSSKPGFEKSVLNSESTDSTLTYKTGLQESGMISKAALSSKPAGTVKSVTSKPGLRVRSSELKPGFEKSDSILTSKTGLQKRGTISKTDFPSKPTDSEKSLTSKPGLRVRSSELNPGFEKSVSNSVSIHTSKTGLVEPRMISKAALSSKPSGLENSLTSKPGSDISEMKKVNFEENEREVECMLRRRVEEFIQKVNTQWKSEKLKSNYHLY